jgi:hypothetical protein
VINCQVHHFRSLWQLAVFTASTRSGRDQAIEPATDASQG